MRTTTATFYGSSDDNFCYDSPRGGDEIGAYERHGIFKLVNDNGEGLFVVGYYAPGEGTEGTWSVGVMPLDEDVPFPDWIINLRAEGYSTRLEINAAEEFCILSFQERTEHVKEWA